VTSTKPVAARMADGPAGHKVALAPIVRDDGTEVTL
jgi:hypothetical protein